LGPIPSRCRRWWSTLGPSNWTQPPRCRRKWLLRSRQLTRSRMETAIPVSPGAAPLRSGSQIRARPRWLQVESCASASPWDAQRLLWCSVLPALTMERAQATGRAFPTLGACAHGAPPCRSHTGELDATCLAADVPGVAANWTAPVCAHQVPPASIAPCLREWHLCIQRTGQPAATSLSPCLGATLGRTRQRLPCV